MSDSRSPNPDGPAEPDPAFMPGEPIPPAATGVPIVGGEGAETPHTRTLAEVAHEVEEEVEGKAAIGFLGGPIVWGLLALLAIMLVYFVAT